MCSSSDGLENSLPKLMNDLRERFYLDAHDCNRVFRFSRNMMDDGHSLENIEEKSREFAKEIFGCKENYVDEVNGLLKDAYPIDGDFLKGFWEKCALLREQPDYSKLCKESLDNVDEGAIKRYQDALDHYTNEVRNLAQKNNSFQFDENDRTYLDDQRQSLTKEVAQRIELDVKQQKYRNQVSQTIEQTGKRPNEEFLMTLSVGLSLAEVDVQDIDQELLAGLPIAQPLPAASEVTFTKPECPVEIDFQGINQELPAVLPQSPVQPTLQPPVQPVPGGSAVIVTKPDEGTPESRPSPWMYGAVGVGLVFVGLAAIGLTRPYQEITESTLDQMSTSLHAILPPESLSGEISMKGNSPSSGQIPQEIVKPITTTQSPVASESPVLPWSPPGGSNTVYSDGTSDPYNSGTSYPSAGAGTSTTTSSTGGTSRSSSSANSSDSGTHSVTTESR